MSDAPHSLPATPPPAGLPGLDPAWSRLVTADDADGVARTWHVLDTGPPSDRDGSPGTPAGTVLCVHGNPTWSYLWRRLLAAPPTGWRVVAVDQLGMGWSERPAPGPGPRRLAQRVADLCGLTAALGVGTPGTGRVVVAVHDWGGPVGLGWALRHREVLAGLVLTNTAVSQPLDAPVPALIRLARHGALRTAVCRRTPAFVRATTALSRPPLPTDVRDAFAAPYATPRRRAAVAGFVEDIPLEPDHASAGALAAIASDLAGLHVPALALWGPRDPVFGDVYLRDLQERLPQLEVHRYEGASHLVTEDRPEATTAVAAWVARLGRQQTSPGEPSRTEPVRPEPVRSGPVRPGPVRPGPVPPPWAALQARSHDGSTAVVTLRADGPAQQVSWAALAERVDALARGLVRTGVRPGHRVALLVPPSPDLTAAVYACWRAGAVIVVADAGLGAAAMGRALRGAGPDHVLAVPRGVAAAAALRVPGRRVVVLDATAGAEGHASQAADRLLAPLAARLGASRSLADIERAGRGPGAPVALPDGVDPEAEAAVVFTSGATGPPKGVVYRQRQLAAQLAVLRRMTHLGPDDRLVAAFAPFALYGPALGIASAVPATDVTRPGTLTAGALADAVGAVGGTVVFASPAALRNVVATAGDLAPQQRRALAGPRLVLSAGAPVPTALLRDVIALLPSAEARTPYGMTEALPVTTVSLAEVEAAGPGAGVCVGRPLEGVAVQVSPLGTDGRADGPLTSTPHVTGEVCVAADHVKDRYDKLSETERDSSRTPGWHRTGDVGHLDAEGRLWIEGRLAHVVVTAAGPLTPVGPESRAEALPRVAAAAIVGVGPRGTQQPVAVVVPADAPAPRHGGLADPSLADAVRAACGVPLAAVLVVPRLPVDIRHASKVDRLALGRWAGELLSGRRARLP